MAQIMITVISKCVNIFVTTLTRKGLVCDLN